MPISFCWIVKATKEEPAFKSLVEAMLFNEKFGSFSQFPCKHEPPCSATDEELDILNAKIIEALKKEGAK